MENIEKDGTAVRAGRIVSVGVAAGMLGVLILGLGACETKTKPFAPIQASKQAAVQAAPVAAPYPSPRTSTKRILACCDSITVGDPGASWRDSMTPKLLVRAVQPVWIVAAVTGTRCTTWAPLLHDLIRTNMPEVVLINCGTNDDMSTATKRAEFQAAHMHMIDVARSFGVKLIVSTIQISDVSARPDLAWMPGFQVQANVILRANAAVYPDVALADMALIPATPENNFDGIHLAYAGRQLYADYWIAAGAAKGWWPA